MSSVIELSPVVESGPSQAERLLPLLGLGAVVPVLVLDDPGRAVDLAHALVAGGLPTLEVTLRTAAALAAVRRIRDEVPGARVGTGTVLNPDDLARSIDAGAIFAVSPGATPALLDAALGATIPLLPGAATASEAMVLLARGFSVLKFFPAVPAGGVAYLRSLGGPLPALRFCPTGGIGLSEAREFLALPSVVCVGGSWVAPPEAVRTGDWARVTALAREAAALRPIGGSGSAGP